MALSLAAADLATELQSEETALAGEAVVGCIPSALSPLANLVGCGRLG